MINNKVFIGNLPLEEAIAAFTQNIHKAAHTMDIAVSEALGFVTSAPVFAARSSPGEPLSAMDGIVLRAADTHGANERNPLRLKIHKQFEFINTGGLIPKDMDAVVMIENVRPIDDETIEIIEAAYPWQHIRQVGEDIIVGDMLLPSKHTIRAFDLGALIQGGVTQVAVYRPIKVGILPTGSEIVQSLEALTSGKILDSNSKVIEAMVRELGGAPKVYPVCPDDFDALVCAFEIGVEENDLFLSIAGSSAGQRDLTAKVVAKLGKIIVHGIALKPGKPTILGEIRGKGLIGLPGYPVSCALAFKAFVEPILCGFRQTPYEKDTLTATLTQKLLSSLKHEERIRVSVGEVFGRWVATPLNREAGSTTSLVKADGILTIPRLLEGLEAGSLQPIQMLKPLGSLKSRVVVIGSHDPLLDHISDQISMVATHVGSFGGIFSLKRKECHLAPIHLLDEASGAYNTHVVDQFFKGERMVLIKGFRRLQGLYVKDGNPKNIQGISDLTRVDVSFVNRQKGAGTRQLLDFELKKRDISPEDIWGYDRTMTTHTAVAISVATDTADVGMGVYSAAKAIGLTFIPMGYESYDFLTYAEYMADERLLSFVQTLQSQWFLERATAIGGYQCEESGKVVDLGGGYG